MYEVEEYVVVRPAALILIYKPTPTAEEGITNVPEPIPEEAPVPVVIIPKFCTNDPGLFPLYSSTVQFLLGPPPEILIVIELPTQNGPAGEKVTICPFTPTAKKEKRKKEITEMKILRTGSLYFIGLEIFGVAIFGQV